MWWRSFCFNKTRNLWLDNSLKRKSVWKGLVAQCLNLCFSYIRFQGVLMNISRKTMLILSIKIMQRACLELDQMFPNELNHRHRHESQAWFWNHYSNLPPAIVLDYAVMKKVFAVRMPFGTFHFKAVFKYNFTALFKIIADGLYNVSSRKLFQNNDRFVIFVFTFSLSAHSAYNYIIARHYRSD